ncbi:MAG: Rpn family recombination-promoting nuclease/putative transposase, partial [Prevotellaceae bacterium]|nr:Rpn family recombination-promoting nuclease/putative transposase [Prevotellaceae bacterium]
DNNVLYADLFNFILFQGEQIIQPWELSEKDGRIDDVQGGVSKSSIRTSELERDLVRYYAPQGQEGPICKLTLAIEIQNYIDYTMPIRCMRYDGISYVAEAKKKGKERAEAAIAARDAQEDEPNEPGPEQERKKSRREISDEFLSQFTKEDRLTPTITVVLYMGTEKWDGPRSVHDMFQEIPKEISALIPDYKMILIDPAELSDEDLDTFKSRLDLTLKVIKYANDKEKLAEIMASDERFNHLQRDEVRVLNVCANMGLKEPKKGGTLDMCKAVQDMIDEASEKAVEEARRLDREAAEEARRLDQEAAEDKRVNGLYDAIKSLITQLGCSVEQAIDLTGLNDDDRQKLYTMFHEA